jgi:thiol-disulfide isomerase/thioredoxin
MERLGLLILVIILSLPVFSQKKEVSNEYEIKFKINGVKDTVVYFGYHFGDKKYVIDTTKIDHYGNAVFSGDKRLHRGIYLVVMPSQNMNYFEVLIGNDEAFFSIETDTADYVQNMKIKGSQENIVFNQYQREMGRYQRERMKIEKEYTEANNNPEEQERLRERMKFLNEEREAYMNKMITDYPDFFFSKILNSLIDVKIPESPKDENGNDIDPNFQYFYFKDHFFDNIDFSEEGMLRTPIYEDKLNYYFARMVVQSPDSLIKETHDIINRTYEGGDSLMFQYTLSRLFNIYDTSKIMGYDAVFVAIAEDWYLSGKATWADSTLLAKISERVEKITPNKIGNVAPDLVRMQSIDDKYYSLHQIPGDYTVMVFWEPGCGHCKKEVPKLMSELRDTLHKYNVSVFAVYTQYDKEEWKKFLDEKNIYEKNWYNVWDGPYPHSNFRNFYDIYSTPVIFVLDKDKKIIGKRLGVESIKGFLDFYIKKEEFEKNNK